MTTRLTAAAATALLLVFALAGCGDDGTVTSPPGPMGISGEGWFWIILLAVFVFGGAIEEFARSNRGPRNRKDDD